MFQIKTPVAFLIFNRPDTTQRVFNTIRQAKPQKLLVVADGPRSDRPGEDEKCASVRDIIDQVDWDCTVYKNYSDTNLGCKLRVSSGLDWIFQQVEEAIILEDDCLPHLSFFEFCEELLEYYRNDTRVMAISGNNFQFGHTRTIESYYFSRYNHCWGWASWQRAWKYYDVNIKWWPTARDHNWLENFLVDKQAIHYWTKIFQSVYEDKIDTWDYQWTLACWLQHGLSILPEMNLVSNIGFSHQGSHTTERSRFSAIPTIPMRFPLSHPLHMVRSSDADTFTEKTLFSKTTSRKIISKINRITGKS
jgi:hypothetical protein